MAKILITGAQGFLGTALARAARSRGFDVWGLGRSCAGAQNISCDIEIPGDWQDRVSAESFDAVFHLAGVSRLRDGEDPHGVNVGGTRNLISALSGQATWLLVASSSGVYGGLDESYLPIDEQSPTLPQGLYATSKLMQERVALDAAAAHKDLNVCVARLANLVGPGQSNDYVFAKIIGEVVLSRPNGDKQISIEVGSLEVSRDFIDVRDASEALLSLLEADARGIFNVATGKEIHLRDALATFFESISETINFVEQIGRFESEIKRQVLSNGKLRGVTGWEPTRDIYASLTDMFVCARKSATGPERVTEVSLG